MAHWDMTWESPYGETVQIALGNDPLQGFWVTEVSGFVADADTSADIRSTGVGVRRREQSIPEMLGSLTLVLAPDATSRVITLSQMYSQFVGLFSQFKYGNLSFPQPDGQVLTGRFRLASAISPPEWNPHTMSSNVLEMTLDLVSDDGVWSGMPDRGVATTDGARRLLNVGDMASFVDVSFTHGTVAIDGAEPVSLPTVPDRRTLSTDPGTGYRITDPETGEVDVDAWSSMRGRPVPGRVEPRQRVLVETTGDVEVSLTPYFTTPWR